VLVWTEEGEEGDIHKAMLPDSSAHRNFAQIQRNIKPNSGEIFIALLAVLLAIITKSSGKIAEFYFERIFERKTGQNC
jgi:hypothetical protein